MINVISHKISTPVSILIAGIILLLMSSCLQKQSTYGVEGIPAVSNDGKYIVCVIAESEGLTHQENGGFRKTTYSTSYWLKQYAIGTGKLLKKKKLVSSAEVNNIDIACYGEFGNNVWLHIDKLRAYDMADLQETTNEEKIASANGVHKNIFPYDDRLLKPNFEKGYIDFTSDKGEGFRLSLANLKISNKEDIPEDKDTKETNTRRILHQDDYGVRCDTLKDKVLILARDSAAAINTNLPISNLHEVAYRMKIFSADYTITKLGMQNSFSYEDMQRLGEATYLNPCFAKDNYRDAVIQLSKPEGYLLIHQDVLGEKSKAIITRIDTDGKKIWETATGVSTKIAHCMLSGKYCIITTNTDYTFSPHIGKDAICIIDTETGKISKPAIKE